MSRVLIVGAGFFGATVAHQLHEAGHDVMVIERREHLAGNAYTRWDDEAKCHVHVYGAHLFHTSNTEVWAFVNKFGTFNNYRHRVKARAAGNLHSFPINLMTINQVFGADTPETARRAIERDCVAYMGEPKNMEEWCLKNIGKTLYELFIEGYTCKQWNEFPRNLPASIIKRLPVRYTYNDDYFEDRYQGIPMDGYTMLIRNMLRGVKIALGVDFKQERDRWLVENDAVVYTGGIDEFFNYTHGRLGYRSLRFEHEMMPSPDFQGTSVVNLCDYDTPATRIIEHKHFTSAVSDRTLITYEYPVREGEAFYPVPTPANEELLDIYRALAKEHFPTVVFGGRLGEYRYLDMHQVVASALACARKLRERLR